MCTAGCVYDGSSAEEAQWKLQWKFGLTKRFGRDDEDTLNASKFDSLAEIVPLICFYYLFLRGLAFGVWPAL